MKNKYTFILLAFTLSCNNPFATTPGTIGKNEVTGIFITSETSPDASAIWGTPNTNYPEPPEVAPESVECNEGEECTAFPPSFRFYNPYPSPSDGNMNANFSLPVTSEVSIWVETAYWSGENRNLPFRVKRPFQVFSYVENLKLSAGDHTVVIDIKSMCSGGDAYPGFYRVFIKTSSGFFSWRDIYIYGPYGTNPPGLGDYEFYQNGCQIDLNLN